MDRLIDCMTLLSVVSISLPMLLYMQCTAVTKCSLTKRFFLCIFSAKAKGEIQALKTLRKQAFSNAARAGQPGPGPRCPARSSSHGRGKHTDGARPPRGGAPCATRPWHCQAPPCTPASSCVCTESRAGPGRAVGSSHGPGVAALPSATL